MPIIAASFFEAWIFPIFLWFVFFPGLVTALIAIAIAGAAGERKENQRRRTSR